MKEFRYVKTKKYNDYDAIYAQCGGPGGLRLVEFFAEKMKLKLHKKLLWGVIGAIKPVFS